MKKIQNIFAAVLICTLLLTACKTTDDTTQNTSESRQQSTDMTEEEQVQPETSEEDREEELLAEQRESYNFYIEELERMLSENRRQEQESEIYQESIGSIYLFSQSAYSGGLQASYTEKGTIAFQLVLTDARTEERQRYDCRLLADGSLWFTYQTESRCRENLPDYTVNEDVLRFARTDFVYVTGDTDIEEEKQQKRQRLEAYLSEETGGEVQEFWGWQDRIYRIDRERELFIDVTEDKEICIAEFLWEQPKRINCQINVSEETLEEVEKYKPEGYSLLSGRNGWDEIAACDLNHDGRMDYVAVTGLLEKEEFAQIFDAWAEDELSYDRITSVEKEQCTETIEKSWEKADLVENYLGDKEEILFLQIVQEGILMRVWSESDIRGKDFLIDKEYFWGTKVWDYLKPEGR